MRRDPALKPDLRHSEVILRLRLIAYVRLEALAVHDGRAGLVVLLLGDPHLLESGERGEDGSADPDGVFPLWGRDDLHLHGGWGESDELLGHTLSDSGEHGGSAREDDVGVEVLADVKVALRASE